MKRYNPKELEPKWQKTWAYSSIYNAIDADARPKYYTLSFFPYPSGAGLHIGHTRNFTITDVVARAKRMQGYNVMQPMGWDSFGLPGENYAIKTGVTPQITTKQNTDNFREQCKKLGLSIDWTREFGSSDPSYYKWTQWFFLLLLERGLAYQQESPQWWCETDKTVLANEQVEAGRCWRCGNLVVKKNLKQWFFKITDYADRLVADLDDLDWPEGIKTMQRNWIGKSTGALIEFRISDIEDSLKVFTTRPDTLFGATFMVLAPEHPLVSKITTVDQKDAVVAYVAEATRKNEIERQEQAAKEKTGVFTGAYAINPVNGKKIPVWVADYVLMGYGTGAIMAVPAHDERDNAFAKKYELPIVPVVEPTYGQPQGDDIHKEAIIAVVIDPKTNKVITLNWGPRKERHGGIMLIGGGVEQNEDIVETAKREITEETGYTDLKFIKKLDTKGHGYFYSNVKEKNYCAHCTGLLFELNSDAKTELNLDEGEKNKFTVEWVDIDKVASLLHDGIHEAIYRQLALNECYSGEGIMVNSGDYDGMASSDAREKIVADLQEQGKGNEQVNYKIRDWLISRQRYWGAPIPIIHCPKDGIVPVPKDQLPLELPILEQFQPSGDGRSPLAGAHDWVHTTCPKCGGPAERETDTMDGFACSSWYFLRFADPHNNQEPFTKDKADYWLPVDMYVGGAEHAVMHLLYARMWTKVMADAGLINFTEPFKALRNQGMLLAADGEKISKSKGNSISPEDIIDQGYGADALRMIVLFLAPFDMATPWSNEGLAGVFRFLQRVWTITQRYIESDNQDQNADAQAALLAATHTAIKKVSKDVDAMGYNTAIAALMQFTNELYVIEKQHGFATKDTWQFALTTLAQLLAPFAPHITEELWADLGNQGSVHVSSWPAHDETYLVQHVIKIAIQVNGKLRGEIEVPHGATQEAIEQESRAQQNVASYLNGDVRKVIYVPNKLVNFVV